VIETLPKTRRREIRRSILNLASFLGITNSKQGMDKKIIALFQNKSNGTFIEIGAADGVDQSNTLLLERKFGWTGLLVEPVKEQFEYCKSIRKDSKVERYILTSFDDLSVSKEIYCIDLGSLVADNNLDTLLGEKQILKFHEKNTDALVEEVPSNTLDSLLKKHNITEVDIFSLDVEGFELNVLDGFSSKSCKIRYLLVEAQNPAAFDAYAKKRGWQLVDSWTEGDFLYKLCG
jgi:FkbM family methyltransferase